MTDNLALVEAAIIQIESDLDHMRRIRAAILRGDIAERARLVRMLTERS